MAVMEAAKGAVTENAEPTKAPSPKVESIFYQLRTLWRSLAASPHRFRIWLLSAGIVGAIGLNMVGQVRLNNWKGDFYNALERADAGSYLEQRGSLFVTGPTNTNVMDLVIAIVDG